MRFNDLTLRHVRDCDTLLIHNISSYFNVNYLRHRLENYYKQQISFKFLFKFSHLYESKILAQKNYNLDFKYISQLLIIILKSLY